jgi:hypothetical protein
MPYCPDNFTSLTQCPQGSYCPPPQELLACTTGGEYCVAESTEPIVCPPGASCLNPVLPELAILPETLFEKRESEIEDELFSYTLHLTSKPQSPVNGYDCLENERSLLQQQWPKHTTTTARSSHHPTYLFQRRRLQYTANGLDPHSPQREVPGILRSHLSTHDRNRRSDVEKSTEPSLRFVGTGR